MKQSEVDSEKLKQQRERKIEEKQRNLKKLEDEQSRLQKQSEEFKAELVALKRASKSNNESPSNKEEKKLEGFDTIDDLVDVEVNTSISAKRKKAWWKRPDCWLDIVRHLDDYGMQSTVRAYKEELHEFPSQLIERSITRWHRDLKSG